MNADQYISLIISSSLKNIFLDYISYVLNFIFSTTILIFFFFSIYVLKKKKEFFLSISAFLTNEIIIILMKEIIRRPRPFRSEIVLFQLTDWSFPSGHAASSFLIAVLASKFWPKYGKYFYSLAALVSFSRLYLGIHYLSDIVAGALIGYTVGAIFIKKKRVVWRFEEKIKISVKRFSNSLIKSLSKK